MQGTVQQGRAHNQPSAGGEAQDSQTWFTRGTGSALSCIPSSVSLQKMLSILRQPPPCSPLRQNVSTDPRSGVNMSELTQRSVPALQSVSRTNLVPRHRQPSGIPSWKGSDRNLPSRQPQGDPLLLPGGHWDPPDPAAQNHSPFLSIPSARSALFHSLPPRRQTLRLHTPRCTAAPAVPPRALPRDSTGGHSATSFHGTEERGEVWLSAVGSGLGVRPDGGRRGLGGLRRQQNSRARPRGQQSERSAALRPWPGP